MASGSGASNPTPDLTWLAGTWRGPAFGGLMEEHWSEAGEGYLVGLNRMVKDGLPGHREFMTIERWTHATWMTVFLVRDTTSPVHPVAYLLRQSGERSASFENPQHEKLSRIDYTREGEILRIELSGRKGGNPMSNKIILRGILLP